MPSYIVKTLPFVETCDGDALQSRIWTGANKQLNMIVIIMMLSGAPQRTKRLLLNNKTHKHLKPTFWYKLKYKVCISCPKFSTEDRSEDYLIEEEKLPPI